MDSWILSDDPLKLVWKLKCSDKTLYCIKNVLLNLSNLAKELTEEFGESHNEIDLSSFDSTTVLHVVDESFVDNNNIALEMEDIRNYVNCMKYLQFDHEVIISATKHMLKKFVVPFDFFYYYYQNRYLKLTFDYPEVDKNVKHKLTSRDTPDFVDKLPEILKEYSDVEKFYTEIKNKARNDPTKDYDRLFRKEYDRWMMMTKT